MRHVERIEPGPGQESVWDYPSKPRIEPSMRHVVVRFGGVAVAESRTSLRLLERAHPPVYCIPAHHVRLELLTLSGHKAECEHLGIASYYDLSLDGRTARNVARVFTEPLDGYEALRGHLAFYPGRVDEAFVDGERVIPQEGGFYAGWITTDVTGPFKGGPGTWTW
jgi:uncharacterized protein (DUF427 family)